ncbi:MAG: hypothetical protein LC624_06565 [Halobacteriales archaeon]|nr:hypothetical protein [Halobacteriales archaeon]
MVLMLPGKELENDPGDNACFACGPRHAFGMHLRFFDDGEAVRAELPQRAEFSGWRGSWHMGLVSLALMDLVGWTVWERLGPSRPAGSFEVTMLGPMAIGLETVLEAHAQVEGDEVHVTAEAVQQGQPRMRLTATARRASPAEAAQVLQVPNLPRSLRPAWEERAAQEATAR